MPRLFSWVAGSSVLLVALRRWLFAFNVTTGAERDRLCSNLDLEIALRNIAEEEGYPLGAIPLLYFSFESQETVDPDLGVIGGTRTSELLRVLDGAAVGSRHGCCHWFAGHRLA